jgi:ankyrin repeat protein
MRISQQEAHHVSVLAGQGDVAKLRATVLALAEREGAAPADVLIACKDDFQQTPAHIAAKSGQSRRHLTVRSCLAWPCSSCLAKNETGSIEALAGLLSEKDKKAEFFNMTNRFSGDRPVHTALRHGYLDVFRALVKHGADPTAENRFRDKVTDYEGDFEKDEVQRVVDEWRKDQQRT